MSIMMVLDYLNEALKKKGESNDNNGSFLYYEDVLKKLSTEVKSWTFISKGNAKYEFEDCDSAVFFLSYVWNLIQLYGTDLDFWVVCWNNEVMGNGSIWFQTANWISHHRHTGTTTPNRSIVNNMLIYFLNHL